MMDLKPLKTAVDETTEEIYAIRQKFTAREVRDRLVVKGYGFGTTSELLDYAEIELTRRLIGQCTDRRGKKKWVSTQETLDFGDEYVFRKAEDIKRETAQDEYSTKWLQKQLVSLVKRTPLLPEWAIAQIIMSINDVFAKLRKTS